MSHVTWQIENVSTVPVFGTSVHPSVGRKQRSQNFRGGTSVRPQESHVVARIRCSRRPSRNAAIASPASQS